MFYIAPPLNAVTRVGSLEEREMLFTSFINGKKIVPSTKRGAATDATETVTEQAVRIAMNARARQKKVVDQIKQSEQTRFDSEIVVADSFTLERRLWAVYRPFGKS
jgi:hypothetical protein